MPFTKRDVELVNVFLKAINESGCANFVLSNPRLEAYIDIRKKAAEKAGETFPTFFNLYDLVFAWMLGYNDLSRQAGLLWEGGISSESPTVPELKNILLPFVEFKRTSQEDEETDAWSDLLNGLNLDLGGLK